MKINKPAVLWGFGLTFIFLTSTGYAEDKAEVNSSSTLESTYAGLASGSLSFAVLGDLPGGILFYVPVIMKLNRIF